MKSLGVGKESSAMEVAQREICSRWASMRLVIVVICRDSLVVWWGVNR